MRPERTVRFAARDRGNPHPNRYRSRDLPAFEKHAQRDKLIETGYVMPHWPKPWGRAADAVEQLVIEEEFPRPASSGPATECTRWVLLT